MTILIALYIIGFLVLLVRFARLVGRRRRRAVILRGLARIAAERVACQ